MKITSCDCFEAEKMDEDDLIEVELVDKRKK